ncbi:MAG: hypothetical protein RIE58_10165 [Vicingaceae bacterium]
MKVLRFLVQVLLLPLLLLVAKPAVFGQSEILKLASEEVEKGNYNSALKIYTRIADKDSLNALANFGAAYSILNLQMDKRLSIHYMERAMRAGIEDADAMFYMALAYFVNLKLDLAEAAFLEYKQNPNGTMFESIDMYLRYIENAREISRAPVSVMFENLGENINTEYPDYYPLVTPDESFLAFTSRRKRNVGARLEFDGFYPSDIWFSKVSEGEFQMAQNCGKAINSSYDEQLVGMTVNADRLFIYSDNIKDYGDIYYSIFSGEEYQQKVKFDKSINSEAFESAATISNDENTFFFASDRPGGLGGKDIYMTRKLPTGYWAEPQNLGANINTEFDEDFPFLFHDGQSLYFSSQGHNSMGGYDLFKSTWNNSENSWSVPVNLGYPVNTPEDNMTISFTQDQLHAYVSCWRKDSKGDLDIYRITFLEKDPRRTIFKCKIVKENSEDIIKNAFVSVIDVKSGEEIGSYAPNPNTGGFVMALQPGNYHVVIEPENYQTLEMDLMVKGKSDFKENQLQEFVVKPN